MIPLFFNPADAPPPQQRPAVSRRRRVLAVTRKPDSASFHHRVVRYIAPLAALGIDVECMTLPRSAAGQWRHLARAAEFDGVWWHRHLLSPWWLPRLSRMARHIVFDFDDPLPFSSAQGGRPSTSRRIRFAALLRRCSVAIPASGYLASLAGPYCPRVVVLPMAIDVPPAPPAPRAAGPDGAIELLWLGSASTQPYLAGIAPVLAALPRTHPRVRLRLVGHEPMAFGELPVDFRPWSPHNEQAALRECHAGLCPMPDTPWTRGKCPYKVLQYMAHGMPWVGSAVGENLVSAGDGGDGPARGLCAADHDAWTAALGRLIDDADLRLHMGAAAHAYATAHHDRTMLTGRLAQLWREVLADTSTPA